jgi:hypothetical protein
MTTPDPKLAEFDVCLNEHAVIKFLAPKCLKPNCIHKYLFKVYGERTVNVSTVISDSKHNAAHVELHKWNTEKCTE